MITIQFYYCLGFLYNNSSVLTWKTVNQHFCPLLNNLITFSSLTIFSFYYLIAYISTNCLIFKPNLVFSYYFLIIKFATIITILHNHQTSYSSQKQKSICSFFLLISRFSFFSFVPLFTSIIAILLKNIIFYFFGQNVNNERR